MVLCTLPALIVCMYFNFLCNSDVHVSVTDISVIIFIAKSRAVQCIRYKVHSVCWSKMAEEYDFVKELPDEYQCHICLSLLDEPHLTTCCGHHFCKECIHKVAQAKQACPMCKADGFMAVIDKNIVRRIRALEVRCKFRAKGCNWQGELRDLENHLDPNHGQCNYIEVDCPKGCGLTILQKELNHHVHNVCVNRDHQCQHCAKVFPFSNMSNHLEECAQLPVACPNGCSGFFPRSSMPHHLSVCMMQPVSCELASIGCKIKVPRRHLAQHMEENSHIHLCMMAQFCADISENVREKESQTKQLFSLLRRKDQEITRLSEATAQIQQDFQQKLQQQQKQYQEKIERLEQQVMQLRFQVSDQSHGESRASIQHRLTILETQVPVPPYYFTVTNFALHKQGGTQWTCPSFYSEVGGYKMAIEVSANGEGVGRDTHVSVYIRIMHGEYDDMLRWPLRASVTIQLISQSDNEAHYEMTTPQYEWSRVTNGVIGVGWGWDKFIPHHELKYNPVRRTEYLKNDRLNFRVICVDNAY